MTKYVDFAIWLAALPLMLLVLIVALCADALASLIRKRRLA